MSGLAQFWNGLPTGGKVAVGGGAVLLVYFVYKGGFGKSSSTAGGIATPSPTAGIPAGTPLGGATGGGTPTTPVPLSHPSRYSVGGQSVASFSQAVSMAKQTGQSLVDTKTNKTLTATTSPLYYIEGAYNQKTKSNYVTSVINPQVAQQKAYQVAKEQPGTPVTVLNNAGNRVDYAITKAGANGKLYTGSSYNSVVNAAGEQYLNHFEFKGHYTSLGKFVTLNPAQQAAYNKIVG